jgi:hypothetical protein
MAIRAMLFKKRGYIGEVDLLGIGLSRKQDHTGAKQPERIHSIHEK